MSEKIEHPDRGLEDSLVIIHDQNTQPLRGLQTVARINEVRLVIRNVDPSARQEDLHRSTQAEACLNTHAATGLFGKTEDSRQSESLSRSFRREEELEHMRQDVGWDTGAGVLDGETHVVSWRRLFGPEGFAFDDGVERLESERAARLHRIPS